jgi:hypothetical protein
MLFYLERCQVAYLFTDFVDQPPVSIQEKNECCPLLASHIYISDL